MEVKFKEWVVPVVRCPQKLTIYDVMKADCRDVQRRRACQAVNCIRCIYNLDNADGYREWCVSGASNVKGETT